MVSPQWNVRQPRALILHVDVLRQLVSLRTRRVLLISSAGGVAIVKGIEKEGGVLQTLLVVVATYSDVSTAHVADTEGDGAVRTLRLSGPGNGRE